MKNNIKKNSKHNENKQENWCNKRETCVKHTQKVSNNHQNKKDNGVEHVKHG